MSFQDHLKTCSYCREKYSQLQESTVRIKSASSYNKQNKLSQLGAIIRGTPTKYADLGTSVRTKGASEVTRKPGHIEREVKLKELGKMIRGL